MQADLDQIAGLSNCYHQNNLVEPRLPGSGRPMNRVDRLFGILLQLQQRWRVRAQDLAARFEISERTIYRDMTALSEVGVPIAALPGERYELMEGYYLLPLVFTPNEAGALSLAAQMFISQSSGRVASAGQAALAKIT